jgi:hypothetical protein
MRTFDDTFSGQRIYPGKVRHPAKVEESVRGDGMLVSRNAYASKRWNEISMR